MEKRGTGWIPDYPDIRDYRLENEAIQNLTNKIQSQGDITSIETLARKVYEALDILAANCKNNSEDKGGRLTTLRDGLEKEIIGDFRFVTAKLHNVLQLGMADSEVLLIKNYLQRIISTWRQFKDFPYEPEITNTTFDSKTSETVIKILEDQTSLQSDGLVSKDDMEALKLLAYGADLDRDINPFLKLIESNAEMYRKQKEDKLISPQLLFCQGILTVYLLPIQQKIRDFKQELQHVQEKLSSSQSQISANALMESLNKMDGNITNLHSDIEEIKRDESYIKQIIDKFKNGLLENNFHNEELRELTDIEQKGIDNILEPIPTLLEKYKSFKCEFSSSTLEIEKNLKLIADELINIINIISRKFEYLIALLYMACPPVIPSQLFKKTEIPIPTPIPDSVVKLFTRKFFARQSSKLEHRQLESEDSSSIQKLTQLIKNNPSSKQLLESLLTILAQMLMPLGQYKNLSEAVEQGIEKIKYLLEDKKYNREETRNLIRMTIEEYNLGIARDYNLIEECKFQVLILRALQAFKKEIEKEESQTKIKATQQKGESPNAAALEGNSIEEGILSQIKKQVKEEPHFIEIIRNFLQQKPPQRKYGGVSDQTKEPLKKPLFALFYPLFGMPSQAEETSSKTTENSSQQMKNSLQFPINRLLRDRIDEEINDEEIKNPKDNNKYNKSVFLSLPEFVDLTYWCSPVEDQGALNSCTAHAAIALMEYAQKKSSDTYIDASPRFLYKVTRTLMQREGDSGASVRDTMKAMVAFGVCPEQYWTYEKDKFDEEPTPFCYSFAENYKTLKYFRLDYASISRYTLLAQVKVLLASEIPCIFGFTLYNSVYDEFNVQRGHIPLPNKHDKVIGGHTVVAVGYDDRKVIENADGEPTEGALLIRNSWGTRWGQGGYGWLPYDYITKGLTADWWSLLKAEWLATGRFGAGASAWNADKGTNEVENVPPPPPP
jgi:C1A family cysteine protease